MPKKDLSGELLLGEPGESDAVHIEAEPCTLTGREREKIESLNQLAVENSIHITFGGWQKLVDHAADCKHHMIKFELMRHRYLEELRRKGHESDGPTTLKRKCIWEQDP